MRAIFISYRREDAEGQAGRLYKDLVQHFGEQAVFMDVAGIEPGRDFRKAIDEHVGSCGVLLALIGKSWMEAKDGAGTRRLDDAGDFVRLETKSALQRDIPVVPVLVHGATMPRVDQLPEDIKELAYRNAIELTHARWDSDLSVLIKALSRYGTPATASPPNRVAESDRVAAKTPPPGTSSPPPPETTRVKPSGSKLVIAGIAAVVIASTIYFLARPGEEPVAAESAPALDAPAVVEPAEATAAKPAEKPAAAAPETRVGSGPHTPFGVADWDGDGHPDIIAREDSSARMTLYPGTGRRGPLKAKGIRIGPILRNFTTFGTVDWDRDGNVDLVARNDGTAALVLYPGRGGRAAQDIDPVPIGIGWNGYTFYGAADWDHDGNQDIVTRNDSNGELRLYPGESVRRMSEIQPTTIGIGWQGHTFFGVTDWDRDGHQDILTRNDTSGDLMLYPGESTRTMSTMVPAKLGEDWNRYTFFGIGDWDGDRNADLVVRDESGTLLLYPGQGNRKLITSRPVTLGSAF